MTRLHRAAWLVSTTCLAAGILACASGQPHLKTNDCVLAPRDSALIGGRPLYRDCAVSVRARRVSAGTRPDFSPPDHRTGCFSVDVELVVDTAGLPEPGSARVAATNDRDFADAVLQTVGTWRYNPARLDGRAVRQIATEHVTAQTAEVLVPMGSGPPSGPPRQPMPPNC
ncbi:MAG TPA: energy transducer TonB [Gemmatimonadaceae bacterium]|nr:energy transducer TonB [Gemmatimonadaceae bacterium]